ncbi:MAG: CBS domain-containing protein [Nitrospiraceae bacterium]|nr:CBS domain-containing protein [Nitrospiraceae bacterium]
MIRARYIMCKRTAVRPNTAGREVAFKMMGTGCPGIPVVDDQMKVLGVVTAFDILKALRSGTKIDDLTVDKVMSGAPQTADPDTPLETLIDMLINNNYSIIPITKNDKLVGIVSRNEILVAYAEPHLYQSYEE